MKWTDERSGLIFTKEAQQINQNEAPQPVLQRDQSAAPTQTPKKQSFWERLWKGGEL